MFLVVVIFSFSYYFMILSYSGMDTDFLYFWLVLGVASILLFFLCAYLCIHKIKVNKNLNTLFFILIFFGISIFAIVEANIVLKGNERPSHNADYVIILGAQVKGSALSKALKRRLDTALIYLNDNPDSKIIVSGGQGKGEEISEALAMKNYLVSMGINEMRIMMEDQSTNTEENIRFSQSFINGKNQKIVVVTNKFHVFRATLIAKKQGMINVEGLGAPTDDILVIHYHVREFFAIVKDKIVGNI